MGNFLFIKPIKNMLVLLFSGISKNYNRPNKLVNFFISIFV